jgi:anaerobic ribonucleoside-triphosphate reductase
MCRAFLSPWYKEGGINPKDENDEPIFVGRFNIGAISLHLPMILAKARQESKDFFDVLDFYLNLIRKLHIRTYEYLGEMRASTNPLGYCEGGFYGGNLDLHDKIKPLLKPMTASFGITALNELQQLYNGKSIAQDGEFALETLKYIDEKVKQFKSEDGLLYAIYGTPAENLCFHGDTEIQAYNGMTKIKDIKRGDLVYSFSETRHKIELKKVIESKMTKRNAVVVKVTFDNDQVITCTPEHSFAVRRSSKEITTGKFNGAEYIEFVPAHELTLGDRIKSNYIHINENERTECSIYHNGKKQLIQDINSEYFFGSKPIKYVVHHKDKNKSNNEITNLIYMKDADHRRLHMNDNISKFSYTSESQNGKKNSFYGKLHTGQSKLINRNKHIGRSIERFDRDFTHLEHFECIEDAKKMGYTRHLIKKACMGTRAVAQGNHYYSNSYWYYSDECQDLIELNHKVKSVEYLEDLVDVYDIEVDDNHNFFVGGKEGLLVHNCGLQVEQFRKKYGIIEGVSDRPYVSNSFHCHVTEDITPIQKQDLENRFWNHCEGGRIQYCKYPIPYNIDAIKTLVRRAMSLGNYEGVNLSLAYCNDCGHQELEMTECPKCNSSNLTKIERMNGYLSYSRVKGDTRLNDAKMSEIKERKSM